MAKNKGSRLTGKAQSEKQQKAKAAAKRGEKLNDQITMNRKARRQERIDTGMLNSCKAGVQGGTVRQNNRRNRKKARQQLNRGEYDPS